MRRWYAYLGFVVGFTGYLITIWVLEGAINTGNTRLAIITAVIAMIHLAAMLFWLIRATKSKRNRKGS